MTTTAPRTIHVSASRRLTRPDLPAEDALTGSSP
jgi:hypothetical protein